MQVVLGWILDNYIELIATLAGIIGVLLTARQIIWCWPVALVNVILYIYIFFQAKLYADFGLQIFYFVMTIYGWYNWMYGARKINELKISRLRFKWIVALFVIGIVSVYFLGFSLKKYTDASLPYWDAITSVWGIIGTYLMARKKIEHWIIWIVIDSLCVGIYYYKELYVTSVLYFVFIILAVYGLIQWMKDYRKLKVTG